MGMKWFQHPETQVFDHATQFTDVRQFLQECSLTSTLEVDHAEMEAVADTFRGVENSNLHHGVFHQEGSSGNDQQAKKEQTERHKHVQENFTNDHTFRAKLVLQDARPVIRAISVRSAENWVKLGESQRTVRLLSYLWKILPQTETPSSKHSIELIEFA